jgi:hypothetical protein
VAVGGAPQPEPDSVPWAGHFTAEPLDENENSADIVEGGGPPRRQLPRSLVVGFYVICGVASLVWLSVTVLSRVGDPVATESANLTLVGNTEPSYEPGHGEFVGTLRNNSNTPLVIDAVFAQRISDQFDPESWVQATVVPPEVGTNILDGASMPIFPALGLGVAGDGGQVVLVVMVDPVCGGPTPPVAAEIVILYHDDSDLLRRIVLPELLNSGPTSLNVMARSACRVHQGPTLAAEPRGLLSPQRNYSHTVENVAFSFQVPTHGWEGGNGPYINKSTVGSQGAEAIIFWTTPFGGGRIEACGQWWGSPVASMADIAANASRVRGTELVSGPSNVAVDGRAAKRVVFTVQKDVACNPGFFHTWSGLSVGAFWTRIFVGDTVRVWLVEVDGKLLYIEGDTHKHAGPEVKREIQQIIDSIRFD